ncbi:MAG: adenosylcobinamide-GDP ribazoletransferase [Desulfobacterales bacterium]|nr:MAG: adenosylcobinamide-GDP ribazoletransferase [Desulfobacterales bacterium]
MRDFFSAIRFITILPWGRAGSFDPPRMIPYFPIVGVALGLLLALFDYVALRLWGKPAGSLLDVVFLAVLTGAFHIDGLGDAADGLLGQRSKEKILAIMKDSRLGTMGLVAIVFGLSMKWVGIAGLDSGRSVLLIIVPAYARASMLFGIRYLKYGRPEGGTGLDFFNDPIQPTAFWGLSVPVLLSFLLGWKMIWLNLCFAALTAGLIKYYKNRVGCITGDMLGAMTEVIEAALFLTASIGGAQ